MEAEFQETIGRLDVSKDFLELARRVFDSCLPCVRDTCTEGQSSQVGHPFQHRANGCAWAAQRTRGP